LLLQQSIVECTAFVAAFDTKAFNDVEIVLGWLEQGFETGEPTKASQLNTTWGTSAPERSILEAPN